MRAYLLLFAFGLVNGCTCPYSYPYCAIIDDYCYRSGAPFASWSPNDCPGTCTSHAPDCTCSASYPYCDAIDGYCYASSSSSSFSKECGGSCDYAYSAPPPPCITWSTCVRSTSGIIFDCSYSTVLDGTKYCCCNNLGYVCASLSDCDVSSNSAGSSTKSSSPPPPSPLRLDTCATKKAECTQSCTDQDLNVIINTCGGGVTKCLCSSDSASSTGSAPAGRPPPPYQEVVLVKMQATGDVSDYGYDKQEQIKTGVATNAGVSTSYVTVTVTAGSVNIYAQIAIPNGMSASEMKTQVSNNLGDATKASDALGIPVTSTAVSKTSTTAVSQSIDNDHYSTISKGNNNNIAAIAGGTVGGVAAVAALAGGAYYVWKKGQQKTVIVATSSSSA